MSIYKACDIRGTFGEELRIEHATALGHALALQEKPSRVLIGGDGRLSTPALKSALASALLECGVQVLDLGNVPTPIFYYARRKLDVRVGVMVTASHNPASDNGFKIALGELPITEEQLDRLRVLMEAGRRCETATSRGETIPLNIVEEYVAFAESLVAPRGGLRLVVDSGNGMWGSLAPRVWRDLGHEMVELFSEVDGRFPNRSPNPAIASHLTALSALVQESGAALGVAYDGDGDRVAFVDDQGEPVDNDHIIVLLARAALVNRPGAVIVYDQKCSDIVPEEIRRGGGEACLERSGYTFIKSSFLQSHAAYAGELSGHHFFAEVGGDDGLIASLKMAELISNSGQSLKQLVSGLPRYFITPDIRLRVAPGEGEAIVRSIKHNLQGAVELSEMDGVRARFPDGWGLVRASVTEPAVTLRFEGHTRAALERIQLEFKGAAPQLHGRF